MLCRVDRIVIGVTVSAVDGACSCILRRALEEQQSDPPGDRYGLQVSTTGLTSSTMYLSHYRVVRGRALARRKMLTYRYFGSGVLDELSNEMTGSLERISPRHLVIYSPYPADCNCMIG